VRFLTSSKLPNGYTTTFELSLAPSIGYRTKVEEYGNTISEKEVGVWLSSDDTKNSRKDKILLSIAPATFLGYATMQLIKQLRS
jgi:hypothetical protein